jgi:polysaccharide biosynthesis transport protein
MAIQRTTGGESLAPAGGLPPAPVDYVDAEYSEVRGRHLRDYARILYKYRWLAATSFCATLGLTLLVTLLTPRLYSATTRLQLAREAPIQLQLKDSVVNLDDPDHSVSAASTFVATQVATLKSRDLAERVIRTHGLATNEAFLHPGTERPGLLAVGGRMLSFLRPRGFNANQSSGADDDDALSTADAPTKLLDRYMSYLDVRDVRGTDLIDVRFTTPTPDLSAMLAAAHTQAYLEANTEARLATDVEAKQFLGKQLEESRTRVARTEEALKRFSSDHPNVAVNQEQKLITQRITEITTQLSGAEADRITAQTQYDVITKPGTDLLAHFLDRPSMEKLYASLLDLRAQRAAFDPRLGPNHPQIVQLREQENEVKRQLNAEVDQQVAAVRAHYDAAVARETGLRTRLAYLEESAVVLRDLGARYDLLKAEVDNSQDLHRTLLKQAMETAVNAQLAASNIRVIERAEVPQAPSRPNLPLNLIVGLAAGIGIALGATVVCESFDNSVKSTADVESQLQLPTLGTIPNFALVKRSMPKSLEAPAGGTAAAEPPGGLRALVVLREPWSPVAESFRSVRTAVLFSTPEAPPKVILLTSAGASEGKTVTSLNLAATLAEAGSRVLLIDADLRRPTCHYSLGVDNARGLSSFLAGQAELKDVIVELEQPRLHFVSGGPTPPNPAEMVGSARMREALAGFREAYDFVIVDSPPVVPVTDAVVLSREADAVVLVVKGHDTPLELVRRARDQLVLADAHIIGAVVNNVDMRWGDLYHYQRFYGYYRAEGAQGAV